MNVCHKEINSSFSSCYLFLHFSDSNAIKGEGLQEGLDWLQGKVSVNNEKCHTCLQRKKSSCLIVLRMSVLVLTACDLPPVVRPRLFKFDTKTKLKHIK